MGQRWDREQGDGVGGGAGWGGGRPLPQPTCSLLPTAGSGQQGQQAAHTKLKGLLVMRNSCFPCATRRLRTANVSSPLRMYFSNGEMGL